MLPSKHSRTLCVRACVPVHTSVYLPASLTFNSCTHASVSSICPCVWLRVFFPSVRPTFQNESVRVRTRIFISDCRRNSFERVQNKPQSRAVPMAAVRLNAACALLSTRFVRFSCFYVLFFPHLFARAGACLCMHAHSCVCVCAYAW